MDFSDSVETLKALIRDVPNFPKKGIVFKDITPLLSDAGAFRHALDLCVALIGDRPVEKIVAIESRGFIMGSALADRLRVGFVPVRKLGKLPATSVRATYSLEYGTDSLEMHADALRSGERVLVVDDVIATGGTARAAAELVRKLGASVTAFLFLIELGFLNGRSQLEGGEILSVLRY